VRTFLADPSLVPLWSSVAAALDRNGLDWRGRLTLPDLTPEGRRRLGIVVDRTVVVGRRSVSLDDLASGVRRMTGGTLLQVLTELGHAPAGRREAAAARQDAARDRRAALDAVIQEFGSSAPWLPGWSAAAWRDGLFAGRSAEAVEATVRRVIMILERGGERRSRTEVAAQLLGDAHALDSATRLATLVTRALVERDGAGTERQVWERAGMPLDLVSAPVLCWALPLLGDSPVAVAARTMTAAGLPLHLSTVALRHAPLRVAPGTPLLVVENPRLVEGAAERRLPAGVLCTNGNATTAPIEAIGALRTARARLRYHGDLDAPGLALTGRAADLGCVPFRMTAVAYLAALAAAVEDDVPLPHDAAPVPPTPWDPALAVEFTTHRLVIHEERVMDDVLDAHAADSRSDTAG
jgi:uncharacterized protein (TIGR02679 family)